MTPIRSPRAQWLLACFALAAVSCEPDGSPNRQGREDEATGELGPDASAPEAKVCPLPGGSAGVASELALDALCGCTEVEGDLLIDAASVSDLECLASLREVRGRLAIVVPDRAPAPQRLSGLEGLEQVDSLTLVGLDVADLEVFSSLRSAGTLTLRGLSSIRDLRGLERVDWRELDVHDNAALRTLDGLRVPESARTVRVAGSPELESVQVLEAMRSVESVVLERLPSLATLGGLAGAIGSLQLSQCTGLTDLRGLSAAVEQLWLHDNASLRSLDGFRGLSDPAPDSRGLHVRIEEHPELESLDGLLRDDAPRFARLQLMGLPKLTRIDLRSARELDALVIRTCPALEEIRGLEGIETMETLHLTGLTRLPVLPSLPSLRRVGDLELIDLPRIEDLEPLSNLTILERAAVHYMDSLTTVRGLENVTRSERLLLEDLFALETLEGLSGLTEAGTLWIQNADALQSLRGLQLQSALELAVRFNDKLETLEGLEHLSQVGTLDLSENPALVSVRALGSLNDANRVFVWQNSQLPQCELDWLAAQLPETTVREFEDSGPEGPCP